MERARWGLGDAVAGFLLGLLAVVVAGNAYVLATGEAPDEWSEEDKEAFRQYVGEPIIDI